MGDEPFEDETREPDPDVLSFFKTKLHKLSGYEDFLWIEKDHLPVFADFIFSFKAKKLFCYMDLRDGQACLKATYSVSSVKKSPEILYFVRDQGFLSSDSVHSMVSYGRCKGSGAELARSMSDLQVMVKRREMSPALASPSRLNPIAERLRAQTEIPRPTTSELKRNAMMPSLSEKGIPSRNLTTAGSMRASFHRTSSNGARQSTLRSTTRRLHESRDLFADSDRPHPLLKLSNTT
mmetsp:Transcript_10044/g.18894  ORF Transcript_10044/g.18894 Transcript_10044/m.18894 type:complete len:236 (-) Transcript_10044:556-1263(-)